MKPVKLEQMTIVNKIVEDETICPNESCNNKGYFVNCYLHTYVYCPIFDTFYNSNTTQQ